MKLISLLDEVFMKIFNVYMSLLRSEVFAYDIA